MACENHPDWSDAQCAAYEESTLVSDLQGMTPEEKRKAEAEKYGFDPATYGKRTAFNVPPGWTVNPSNGALFPPGSTSEVQNISDGILPGEFFQMGSDLYQWSGESVTEASETEKKQFVADAQIRSGVRGSLGGTGRGGTGVAVDPYAGEANARANAAAARDAQRLQEEIRAQRIDEAQKAIAAYTARAEQAQQARLEGAKFAVTPSMTASGGYFPGLQPNSPVVQQGLAQPFQYQPIGFNPNSAMNINDQQVAQDLARIRGMAK